MDEKEFNLTLTRGEGFQFVTEFDGEKMAKLLLDEPLPLGEDEGPNAARVLGAAVGNCLSASLLFCLKRARVNVDGMRTEVHGRITRNEKGRFRIAGSALAWSPRSRPRTRSGSPAASTCSRTSAS